MIFLIFLLFFWNILARVLYERNSGVKFCFHFFDLSHPVWAKNNTGKWFYNFLNFFAIFFGIFLPGSSMNGILELNFVFTFSVYLIPVSEKIMPGRGFIIFWIFLLFFFRNFLSRVEYERNSGLKFFSTFLGPSHPFLLWNNAEKRFFNFFAISFGISLPESNMNGIRA